MAFRAQVRAINRRWFLRKGAHVVGMLGAAAAVPALTSGATGRGDATANAFAYDVRRLSKTDPKLIIYERVNHTRAPRPDAKRIIIGPGGEILVAAGNYISVLDAQGNLQMEMGLPGLARGLAVDGKGTVYVALRDHLEVFSRSGERQSAWESPGPRTWFTGLAVSEDHVFAADAGNRVLLKYDRIGKVLGRLGAKGGNNPGLIVPSPYLDVELHRDGLLRVNNPGRHRVEAYTLDGEYEASWGKATAAIEGFCGCCNPINLALLPDGRIITCEKGLPRVKVYAEDGTFEGVVAGPESFPENSRVSAGGTLSDGTHGGLDATVDRLGRVYILDLVTSEIHIMARKKAAGV